MLWKAERSIAIAVRTLNPDFISLGNMISELKTNTAMQLQKYST
jgi:hypothetical protein